MRTNHFYIISCFASLQHGHAEREPQPNSFVPHQHRYPSHRLARACHSLSSAYSGDQTELPSASSIWRTRTSDIIAASRHPDDTDFRMREWTAELFAALSSKALRRSVRSPADHGEVSQLIERAELRRAEKKQAPIRILVLGGSPTHGSGSCDVDAGVVRFNDTSALRMARRTISKVWDERTTFCRWSFRLETLLNNLLGYDAVRVVNLASGGTTSWYGTFLVEHRLYPPELQPSPDVIIWAYAVNDALAELVDRTEKRTHWDTLNAFIHAAVPEQCGEQDSPLLVLFDDFLGNSRLLAHAALQFNAVSEQLASWHRILLVSYAESVRDFVMDNSSETSFVALTRNDRHPPLSGHLAKAWVLAFSALDALTTYCEDSRLGRSALLSPQAPSTRPCENTSNGLSQCSFGWLGLPYKYILSTLRPYLNLSGGGWQLSDRPGMIVKNLGPNKGEYRV